MYKAELIARAIFGAGILLVATSAQGQQKKVRNLAPDLGPAKPTSILKTMFGGTLMNDSRASAIAAREDFDFIAWQPCPAVSECIVLEVKGRQQGWIYQYVLVSEKCRSLPTATGHAPGAIPARPRAAGPAAALPKRMARAAADDSAETADPCFGGYYGVIRARQHDSYSADSAHYTARFEEDWQVISGGKWTPFVTSIQGAWEQPVPNTGLTERGSSYSWVDPSGKVLQSDSSVVDWIASTGATGGVTAKDLCLANQALKKDRLTEILEKKTLDCNKTPIPQSVTVTGGGTVDAAPLGVGGKINLNIGGTKTLDFCALGRNVALQMIAVAADEEYQDCLLHPGRYFPSVFPPESGALDLADVHGFDPVTPSDITIDGICPIDKKVSVGQDMGGGVHCTTTVTYSGCTQVKNKQGGSECTCSGVSQSAQVCTGG